VAVIVAGRALAQIEVELTLTIGTGATVSEPAPVVLQGTKPLSVTVTL
jgi:hypothetical protein